MGNKIIKQVNYEDVQYAIRNKYAMINTMPEDEQDCLIVNTFTIQQEIEFINACIHTSKKDVPIILYGKHCNDKCLFSKHQQLQSLGFTRVYTYVGGMFEWLLLQDIYGDSEFPTTRIERDILKYKSPRNL